MKSIEILLKKVANLMSVKSLVTICLTIVFSVMTVKQAISQEFMSVYLVVISFYFGTQSSKIQDMLDGGNDGNS